MWVRSFTIRINMVMKSFYIRFLLFTFLLLLNSLLPWLIISTWKGCWYSLWLSSSWVVGTTSLPFIHLRFWVDVSFWFFSARRRRWRWPNVWIFFIFFGFLLLSYIDIIWYIKIIFLRFNIHPLFRFLKWLLSKGKLLLFLLLSLLRLFLSIIVIFLLLLLLGLTLTSWFVSQNNFIEFFYFVNLIKKWLFCFLPFLQKQFIIYFFKMTTNLSI